MKIQLIPNARHAWKMLSVRLATLVVAWGSLPADTQASIVAWSGVPPANVPAILGLLVIGGRLLQQASVHGAAKP